MITDEDPLRGLLLYWDLGFPNRLHVFSGFCAWGWGVGILDLLLSLLHHIVFYVFDWGYSSGIYAGCGARGVGCGNPGRNSGRRDGKARRPENPPAIPCFGVGLGLGMPFVLFCVLGSGGLGW